MVKMPKVRIDIVPLLLIETVEHFGDDRVVPLIGMSLMVASSRIIPGARDTTQVMLEHLWESARKRKVGAGAMTEASRWLKKLAMGAPYSLDDNAQKLLREGADVLWGAMYEVHG